MPHSPWGFTILDDIAECFEERLPIPLHLAVQMTPAVLQHAWSGAGSINVWWKRDGQLSIRNYITFSVRPRHFAEAVLELMGKNIGTLKKSPDAHAWESLRLGLDATKALLAGEADRAAMVKVFASSLLEMNSKPWNSSWIIFALGAAVEAIDRGYDTDHGVTMLLRALRVGIQGKVIHDQAFPEEIARRFERFLTRIGPPPAEEIVGAAIRNSQEPP